MSFLNLYKTKNFIIEKNELGYYEVINKPRKKELNKYYSDLLYQTPKEYTNSYSLKYNEEELENIENKSKKIYAIVKNVKNKKLLDVGCGEGYLSKFFLDKNYIIKSLDFSEYAIKKHNPSVYNYFVKGDVFDNLDLIIEKKEKYGIIVLNNVIEHVLNPKKILKKLNNIIEDNGLIVITAPNDFSFLQSYLLDKKLISKMNWLAPPIHLSYFTLNSLKNLIEYCGYELVDYYSDYPIDFDLLVNHTNYIENKEVGKYSHKKRLRVDNFLCNQSIEKTIKYYKKLADLNCGRNNVIFIKKK